MAAENYDLNLPITTTPLHMLQQASSQHIDIHHHQSPYQPTTNYQQQQHHHQQQQSQQNIVASTCSSLLSNTFAAISTTGRHIDFNQQPCENNLRSWGSTVSLCSNTSSASSSPSTPNSTLNEEKSSSSTASALEGRIDCAVCEDKASGKHYGVMTCEGCKSFFKRSIRRNLQYACRVNNTCSVDKHRRNQCQACRLNKCFRAGMKKDAVQRGRQTVTSRYSPYSSNSSNNNKLSQQQTQQQNEASTIIISEFLTSTTTTTSPSLQSNFTIDAASNNFGTKGINYLLNIIQWAKSNSFFPALTVSDQAALLKLSWKDLFVLTLSEPTSSLPIQLMDIVRDSSMVHDETFISYVKSFQRHLDTLSSLQLDPAELACLKALLLFTPDAPGLSDTTHVQDIQTKILSALESYTRLKGNSTPQQPDRCSKLLLCLSSLRTINPVLLSQIFFVWSYGKAPMLDDVIQDMLLASYNTCNTYSTHHNTSQDMATSAANIVNTTMYQQSQQYYQHCNPITTSM